MNEVVGCDAQPGAAAPRVDQEVASVISEMRGDLDRIVPHIISILRRDEEGHRQRLAELERRSRELPTWPMAVGVHAFAERMRRTEMSPELFESIEVELNALLTAHGFRSFGRVGEAFESDHHEVASSFGRGAGPWVVDEVLVRGLAWMEQVVQRAVVTVSPAQERQGVNDER